MFQIDPHMREQAPTTFALPAAEDGRNYDQYSERFAIGQILTRFALNLSVHDDLPEETERLSLAKANITSCRANLLRLIAMNLMSPDRESRPTFAMCRHDVSTWKDEKFHHFLIRFYDFFNGNYTRRVNTVQEINELSNELLNGQVLWLNPTLLPPEAYNSIIKGGRKFEMKKPAYAMYARDYLKPPEFRVSGRNPQDIWLINTITKVLIRDFELVGETNKWL